MALDDLDLEFEDEEEAKKKKNDAVPVDVDLEFSSPASGDATRSHTDLKAPPPAAAAPAAKPMPAKPPGEVKKLDDARAAAQVKKPASPAPVASARPVAPQPQVSGSAALETTYEVEAQQMVEMREEMRRVEFDANVKVAVAEFKTELLSELLSDTKLMQHQIEQLLVRIHAKHPDMKQEVLMIKKILADFNAKKRK